MKLKPYQKYKDSGIQWIGDIPEGWEVMKIKHLLKSSKNSIKTGPFGSQLKSDEMEDSEIKVYNQRNVLSKDERLGENFVSKEKYEELISFKVGPNDLLITTRGTIGKCLRLSEKAEIGLLHPCLMKISTNKNKVLDDYIELVIEESELVKTQFFLQSNATTIEVIYQDNLKEIVLFIPEISEQNKISSYLDSKTSQISQTISADKQLIDLLKEKRTALINHVVTKGLNPKAKMKDSGIEWIGEVPEGWEVRKIRHCFDIIGSGTTPSSSDESYYAIDEEEGISWVNTGDLNDTHLKESSKRITKKALMDFSALKIYPKNSLIIAMYGATIGKTSIVDIESTYNQACCVLNNSKKLLIEYAHYWFLAKKEDIIALSYGGGQPNISQDVVKKIKITVPSMNEQLQISEYLDKSTSKIDQTIKKIEEKIELLEEYKKSLIHHVVTGKVDVRGVMA